MWIKFGIIKIKIIISSTTRFVSVPLVLVLLDHGQCALDVECESRISSRYPSDEHSCFILEFPHFNPHENTLDFFVNYAQPSDIRRIEFVETGNVKFIPREIFTTFPNVLYFRMNTNLSEIVADDFANAQNLCTLKLGYNKLQIIRNDVFSFYARMSNKRLYAVYPLHKLSILFLEGNEILEIEDYAFYGLDNLFHLELQDNQLTVIRRQTFGSLPSLNILNLSHNRIEFIENGAFDLPALETLLLGRNQLKRLSETDFQRLPKMNMLNLDDNGLERIDQALYGLESVRTISLNRNRIEDIDLAAFAKLPHLDTLELTQSGFSFVTTLIDETQSDWDSSLYTLKIGDNNLTDESELFKLKIFPRLEVLNLDQNQFWDLEVADRKTLKDILPSLALVYLRRTAIECDDLIRIVQELKLKQVDVVHDC